MRDVLLLLSTILYVLVSEILLKIGKLFTLIIHGTRALVYTKKYIPVCISPYLELIRCIEDNKIYFYAGAVTLFHQWITMLTIHKISQRLCNQLSYRNQINAVLSPTPNYVLTVPCFQGEWVIYIFPQNYVYYLACMVRKMATSNVKTFMHVSFVQFHFIYSMKTLII